MSEPIEAESGEQITQRSASNLALSFIALEKPRRKAMTTLYAFCRQVDDVADEDSSPLESRRIALQDWREDVQRACDGGSPRKPLGRKLHAPSSQTSFTSFVTARTPEKCSRVVAQT